MSYLRWSVICVLIGFATANLAETFTESVLAGIALAVAFALMEASND